MNLLTTDLDAVCGLDHLDGFVVLFVGCFGVVGSYSFDGFDAFPQICIFAYLITYYLLLHHHPLRPIDVRFSMFVLESPIPIPFLEFKFIPLHSSQHVRIYIPHSTSLPSICLVFANALFRILETQFSLSTFDTSKTISDFSTPPKSN